MAQSRSTRAKSRPLLPTAKLPSPPPLLVKSRIDLLRATVYENPYIPCRPKIDGKDGRPHCRQLEALAYNGREMFYGGAVGGGKSDFILMAGAQYLTEPGYSALILRRTFPMLMQDGGLIPRSRQWWHDKAHWDARERRWTFPIAGREPATVTFGYIDHERDLDRYQGGAWNFVGVDEAGQVPEKWCRFFFSRLRRSEGCIIPNRIRLAGNPGGIGHEWLKKRFVDPRTAKRHFVKSLVEDNPGLDAADYIESLNELDPITRAQLLAGDWNAFEGGRFRREWFREFICEQDDAGDWKFYLQGREDGVHVSRCWLFAICDPAATAEETTRKGTDPDYTVISVFAVTPLNDILVLRVFRERLDIDRIVGAIAEACGEFAPMWCGIECDGFQQYIFREAQKHSGVPAVKPLRHQGRRKLVRATPAINRVAGGTVYVPEDGGWYFPRYVGGQLTEVIHQTGDWVEDFVAECVTFTGDDKLDAHDDQVDTLAYAVLALGEDGLMEPVTVGDDAVDTETDDSDTWERDDTSRDYGGMFGWRR